MPDRLRKTIRFLEDLVCRFEDDDVTALGAQMTYYFILAFFPFLIFLLTMVSLTPIQVEEALIYLEGFVPEATFRIISDILQQVLADRNNALLSFGMVATFWAASRGMTALIRGMNKAYDEKETRPWWKLKGMALLFTLALAVVLLFALALLVFGHPLGRQLFIWLEYPGYYEPIWDIIKYSIPAGAMIVVFMVLYRYVPNAKLSFKGVIPGSIFASVGWIVISVLFSFYVNHFGSYARTYGSIGGIIVLLIWLYLSSIIILMGGEINATILFNKEGRIKPKCKSFSKRLIFWK